MNDLNPKTQTAVADEPERTRSGVVFSPRIDIAETEHELILLADLPGVTSENLDIRYEDGQLTLQGTVPPRNVASQPLVAEYGVGDFHRTFKIGESIDASRIAAELKNGVLTLHLSKVEKVLPRRIDVKAG